MKVERPLLLFAVIVAALLAEINFCSSFFYPWPLAP